MNDQRARYRSFARRSGLVAAIAVVVAFVSFFALVHGSFPRIGKALIGGAFLVVLGAQAVFFWAFFAGRLYRQKDNDSSA